jgi:hypothetical protein
MQGERRAGRAARLAVILALVSGTLVIASSAAHAAFTSCGPAGSGCPVFANEDDYNVAYGVAGTTLTIDKTHGLLANDEGPTGTKVDLADTVDGLPSHDVTTDNGFIATVNGDGSFTYKADETFSGIDAFNYFVFDPTDPDNLDFNQALITIVPIVLNATYYTRGPSLDVAAPGALANDAGVDPTTLTLDNTSAHGADVTDNGDGAFTYTPPSGYQGHDTFGYTAYDLNSDLSYDRTVNVYVDSTKPTVTMSAPTSSVSLSPTITVKWSGADNAGGSGFAHYDVQMETGAWNSTFTGWKNWHFNTIGTSAAFKATYGHSYCFRVRAVDRARNTSAWSQRCTSMPLKAASMSSYSGGWSTSTSTAYFGGAARFTKTFGAKTSRTNVHAKHIWLVVTKSSNSGTVQVRWNNVVQRNISLARSTTAHRQVVLAVSLPSAQTGTLTLINASSNRYFILEGVDVFLG